MPKKVRIRLELLCLALNVTFFGILLVYPVPFLLELVMVLIPFPLTGWAAVRGAGAADRYRALERLPFYRRYKIVWLVLAAIFVVLTTSSGNAAGVVIMAYHCLNSVLFLLHLVLPNKLPLSDKLPDE